jgi:hypothetical protein
MCGQSSIKEFASIALPNGNTSHRTADTSGVRWKTDGKRKIKAFSTKMAELKMFISSIRQSG